MMKKMISFMLVLLLCVSSVVMVSADGTQADAEASMKSVYLSDNGDDTKDGLTAETAVKTFEKAEEILGAKGGIILIPDIYTYDASFTYFMPYTNGASYIIRGAKEDGSSIFAHGRKNIAMNNPITFDNLTYKITATTGNASLIANFNRLEITDTVKTVPLNEVEERGNCLIVYGGGYGSGGDATKHTDVTLNGGLYNYVVGGCQKAEMYGNINLTIGGNAKILNRIYTTGEGTPNDVYGTVTLNIEGGTVVDNIYAGGAGDGTYCSGNVFINLTGGSIKNIYCRGSLSGTVSGNITIDISEYAPAQADATWADTYICDKTDKTRVIVEKVVETAPLETELQDVPTEAPTEEATVPATDAPATNAPETQNPTDEEPKKGCSAVLGGSVILAVALVSMGGVALSKKKED